MKKINNMNKKSRKRNMKKYNKMGTDKKIDTFYLIFNGLFPIAH